MFDQVLEKIYLYDYSNYSKIIKKTKTLSFAGAWENIDDSVFNDLTKNLISMCIIPDEL